MASKLRRLRTVKWSKRLKIHGFRARMATTPGRAVLAKRRLKGRHELCVRHTK